MTNRFDLDIPSLLNIPYHVILLENIHDYLLHSPKVY